MEVDVRFRYISIKGDWECSKAEGAFLNIMDGVIHSLHVGWRNARDIAFAFVELLHKSQ